MKKTAKNTVQLQFVSALCLCLGLILSGCTPAPVVDDNQFQHIVEGNTYGYYLDVFSAESKDTERTGIIEMSSYGEELFAEIENAGQDRILALQVYVDYKQVPIIVDNAEHTSYLVDAGENYSETISFKLPSDIDTSLNHKMLVVLVAGADVLTSQTTFELSSQYAIALDYILSFNDNNDLAQSEYPYTEIEVTNIQSSGIMLNTDFSRTEQNRLPERKISVNTGESYDLQLLFGGYENVSDVAVIISVGLTQTKVNQSDYVFCKLQDGAYSRKRDSLLSTPLLHTVQECQELLAEQFSDEIDEWVPCDMSYRFTMEVLDSN